MKNPYTLVSGDVIQCKSKHEVDLLKQELRSYGYKLYTEDTTIHIVVAPEVSSK